MYRKIKRFSCLLLAVLLTPLLAALPVHAASFHDVPGGAWYAGAVSSLADQGILAGTGDGYFSPEQKLTRAAFVTMLAKTELSSYDLSQYNFKGSFKDVPASYWANTFINWAAENGIVRGTGDGNFRPGDLLSRQDMAVMVTARPLSGTRRKSARMPPRLWTHANKPGCFPAATAGSGPSKPPAGRRPPLCTTAFYSGAQPAPLMPSRANGWRACRCGP